MIKWILFYRQGFICHLFWNEVLDASSIHNYSQQWKKIEPYWNHVLIFKHVMHLSFEPIN
jgi:hypothetical protein